MPNHTPGPWVSTEKGYIQKFPENPIKTVTICNVFGGDQESSANAKIIAAAPDLLEALERLLLTASAAVDPNKNDLFTKQFFKARDKAALAINKATN